MTVQIIEFDAQQKAHIDELAQEYRDRVEGQITLAKRVDANQPDIVKALRQVGATVQILSDVGKGVPDLLVGRNGKNFLLELKDGNKPPSAQRLTPYEVAWHSEWRGTVIVVNNVEEAIYAVTESDL